MKILVAHNAYRQPGGEDAVVEEETRLLREHGHEVMLYSRHNLQIVGRTKPLTAFNTLWSFSSHEETRRSIKSFKPDLLHVHNTFPLISPSVYWAASSAGVPVIQTLHNFRLLCPQAMLLRKEAVCEDCVGKLPWRGIVRRCYRNSAMQSSVVVTMLALNRAIGSYKERVARYIALSKFAKAKFEAGGLPAERMVVKPNFVDGGDAPNPTVRGHSPLFVGRLSKEKGTSVLLAAFQRLRDATLTLIGVGPDEALFSGRREFRMLGWQRRDVVRAHMERAGFLVLPSVCYEGFPRTLVEAFAAGLPVIASRIGALAELVADGQTGLLVAPGSAEDLARKIKWAQANPEAMRQMGVRARREYEELYTPENNYKQLVNIYEDATREVHSHAQ